MYHALVRRRSQRLYSALSSGDPQPMLDSFANSFAYTFVGHGHPLAGTRRNRTDMAAQLDRVLRLFPGIRFGIQDVLVKGWPWKTRIAIVLTVSATLHDGSPYRNDIVQFLSLRWGQIHQVRTVIDTARLTDAFGRLAAIGIGEASAAPVS